MQSNKQTKIALHWVFNTEVDHISKFGLEKMGVIIHFRSTCRPTHELIRAFRPILPPAFSIYILYVCFPSLFFLFVSVLSCILHTGISIIILVLPFLSLKSHGEINVFLHVQLLSKMRSSLSKYKRVRLVMKKKLYELYAFKPKPML